MNARHPPYLGGGAQIEPDGKSESCVNALTTQQCKEHRKISP
jgi:hypothetical protein